MPIGSFLGHRSQASDEIRHISGHNVNEFKEFLQKYDDIFCVKDDYVVLRSVLDQVDENGEKVKIERFVEEKPIDSYLMNRLVTVMEEQTIKLTRTSNSDDNEQYLTECVNSSVSLDQFFKNLKEALKGEPRVAQLVPDTEDLYTILKMNSRSFHVQANMVSITEECCAKLLKPDSSTSNVCGGSYLNSNSSSLYNLNNQNSLSSLINVTSANPNSSNDQIAANDSHKQNGSLSSNPQASPPTSLSSSSSNASTSNRILNTSTASFLYNVQNTLQQKQRDVIIKTLNANNQPRTNGHHYSNRNPSSYTPFQIDRNFERDLSSQISIITSLKDGESLVNHLIAHSLPVAIDIEGINLNANGHITLVQMAVREDHAFPKLTCLNKGAHLSFPRVYVFDVLFNMELMRGPLKQLFESTKLMKIFHDCRNASACLNNQFKIQLQNVFDLQVAHAVLDQQVNGKPVYKPKFMSMKSLCDRYAPIEFNYDNQINKKSIKRNFKKDNQYWGQRPLKEEMLFYASIDVFLIQRFLFYTLKDDICSEYYPLLEQLNEEAILAKISPEDVKKQKKKRKTDMEVMDLKNKLFTRKADLIVLSNREIRLLR